jgi:hypothetical protein
MRFNNNQKNNHNHNQKNNQLNHIFTDFEKYMFTNESILLLNESNKPDNNNILKNDNIKSNSLKKEINKNNKNNNINNIIKNEFSLYTPFQKDKLFWCFYIILHGFNEYELHHSDYYITEKNFKISSVEKLRSMKPQIKEMKLKMKFNEIEDELVNQSQITLKGLDALCFIYKVSIVVISGKTYCDIDFNGLDNDNDNLKKGIIIQTSKDTKEYSIRYSNNNNKDKDKDKDKDQDEVYLTNVRNTFWKIENVQKPLNAVSGYTIKELHTICSKLDIPIVSELGKNKTKPVLYQEILSKL